MTIRQKATVSVGAMVLVVAGAVMILNRRPSDDYLRKTLVGAWRAADTQDAALHRRSDPVSLEQTSFHPDGTLDYKVVMKDAAVPPDVQRWGWEVLKGKLVLTEIGPDSTHEKFASLRFQLDHDNFAIRWKDRPAKVFKRVDE